MQKSTDLVAALLFAGAMAFGGPAFAQAAQQGQSAGTQPAASASKGASPDEVPPTLAAPGGIQGQNIFEVKPELKKDASSEPGYMDQTNGQRNAVQPHNNAPMWRAVQRGDEVS
jgi:formate dehydrogenase subunit gamma